MSLLVDPDYFLHSLRLSYLRRLADPYGPNLISFSHSPPADPSSSEQPSQAQAALNDVALANPYIQLSGLADSERWPELLVRGTPPEAGPSFSHHHHSGHDGNAHGSGRRRARHHHHHRGDGDGLKHSETIVGKGSVAGAGMRVSGRNTLRRDGTAKAKASGLAGTMNPAETALSITEGRTELGQGGLNPEDSDESISPDSDFEQGPSRGPRRVRQGTEDTVREKGTHGKHPRTSVTFEQSSPPQRDEPDATQSLWARRRKRFGSIASAKSGLTMTTISSDTGTESEPAADGVFRRRAVSDAPTFDSVAEMDDEHEEEVLSPIPQGDGSEPDGMETPQRRASVPATGNEANAYYADPDKRLSDMLFRSGGEAAPRRARSGRVADKSGRADGKADDHHVGSVQLEPAPFTVIGGGADRKGLGSDGEEEDLDTEGMETYDDDTDNVADGDRGRHGTLMPRRKRTYTDESRVSGATSGTTGTEGNSTTDTTSIGKSLSNTFALSFPDGMHSIPESGVVPSPSRASAEPEAEKVQPREEDVPAFPRRRERRRVNIKLGDILALRSLAEAGPPQADGSANGSPKVQARIGSPQVSRRASGLSLNQQSGPRPQLSASPESADAVPLARPTPSRSNSLVPSPKSSMPDLRTASLTVGSGSAGRARSRTTPTPLREEISPGSTDPAGKQELENASHPTTVRAEQMLTISAKPKRPQLSFGKTDVTEERRSQIRSQTSNLTAILNAQSASPALDNPFRTFYASLASRDRGALKLKVYFPFPKKPSQPLAISMRPDVCIEEVVGFALWSYVEEAKEPKLEELEGVPPETVKEGDTVPWSLRLVEDDGEVDEDFPALERSRPASKVGSTEFAVVIAPPAQAKQNAITQGQIQRRPSRILAAPNRTDSLATGETPSTLLPPPISATMGGVGSVFDGGMAGRSQLLADGVAPMGVSAAAMGEPVYLRIRIPSPHKGVEAITTTLNVPTDMYLADVLEQVCKKKDLGNPRDWALIVPATSNFIVGRKEVVVPLDRTVESLQGVNLLALVKRSQVPSALLRQSRRGATNNTNPSASIFKRLSEPPQPKYVTATDLTTTFKSYQVHTKRRGILGKQERMLSIDGDYVHIGPPAPALLAVHHANSASAEGKTSSYHATQLLECARRGSHGVKLVVWREAGQKRYDVEAEDAKSAAEIVAHVKAMIETSQAARGR